MSSHLYQHTPKAMAMAAADIMMRLRSSSRCCSRPMVAISRSSTNGLGGWSKISGIVMVLRDRVLDTVGQPVQSTGERKIFVPGQFGHLRRNVLAGVHIIQFKLPYLLMNLALELAAGLLKFGHEFPQRPGDFRQLLWPKQHKGQ